MLVVRCDEFYDDYRPREGSMDWRQPPALPRKRYKGWDIFKVDAAKAAADGVTRFRFGTNEYVNWF